MPRSTIHRFRSRAALAVLLSIGFAPRLVQAQDDHVGSASPADVTAGRSAALGAFSTWTMTARTDMQHAAVRAMGGPTVTVSAGSFAVTGGTGLVANRLRLVPGTNMGAIGYVGVGAAF